MPNKTSTSKSPVREYTLLRGTHVRREDGQRVVYQANSPENSNKIRLTDEEAAIFASGRLSPQPGTGRVLGQYELESPGHSDESDTDWSFIHEQSAPDVIAAIEALEDASEVEALREEEVSGKNRKGVLAAADNRLAELQEEEEEEKE